MIEDFVKLIPEKLMGVSGSVFCSGRRAYGAPSDLYILDYHPGWDPKEPKTIRMQTCQVLKKKPDDWVSWICDRWGNYPEGGHPTQKRVRYLFDRIKRGPGEVPAGMLIFQRSKRDEEKKELAEDCWPFNEAVISTLKVRVVVCLGIKVGEFVSKKLDAQPTDDYFTEDNRRRWKSRTYKSPGGLYVVALTSPSLVDWTKRKTDPTELVQRALEKVR